jgi:hypothetical protein
LIALWRVGSSIFSQFKKCKPYELSLPIRAKKEYLVFDGSSKEGRRVTKEGTIEDASKLMDF